MGITGNFQGIYSRRSRAVWRQRHGARRCALPWGDYKCTCAPPAADEARAANSIPDGLLEYI